MKQFLRNIFYLGVKEIRGFFRDPLMVLLVVYVFTFGVYSAAKATPDTISNAVVAVVDEDQSTLSHRISDAFQPPLFKRIDNVRLDQVDPGMDKGLYTFVVVIPVGFQRDVLSGKQPEIQLNVDATRMSQAFTGSGYLQNIIQKEISTFINKGSSFTPVQYVIRNRFNPNLIQLYFSAVMQLVNNITMLTIILAGSALIRERERGTLEHLLVMPVTSFEIMVSKIWSMTLVVLCSSALSLIVVVKYLLKVPIEGSIALYLTGVLLHLFAVASLGIFLGTVAQNMPQLGMLLILVLMPMQILSGANTPQESMPRAIQLIMQLAPTTHFVNFSQAILFRGAGLSVVWIPFVKLIVIGTLLFALAWKRFKKSVA